MLLEEAISANIPGIITTYVYSPTRMTTITQYINLVEQNGGCVHLVRLHCDKKILHERVANADRGAHGKITDPHQLEKNSMS